MSRELGVQFAREGIRVNALLPGPGEHAAAAGAVRRDPERAARRLVHIPIGRFAEPAEIAAAVAFLASDDASFITASSFLVDGGIVGAYVTPCDAPGIRRGACRRAGGAGRGEAADILSEHSRRAPALPCRHQRLQRAGALGSLGHRSHGAAAPLPGPDRLRRRHPGAAAADGRDRGRAGQAGRPAAFRRRRHRSGQVRGAAQAGDDIGDAGRGRRRDGPAGDGAGGTDAGTRRLPRYAADQRSAWRQPAPAPGRRRRAHPDTRRVRLAPGADGGGQPPGGDPRRQRR